ncbi:MAG TPA: tyrosine-type recombinase/integrase [Leptolyngbyaceae cyanobacterium]
MPFQPGQNPNRPPAGSTIRVEPIRDRAATKRIKKLLRDQPRDLCLFTLGINTAFRANELLSIKVGQVRSLGVGDVLAVKQSKTDKYRQVTLNKTVVAAVEGWLTNTDLGDSEFLFKSQRGVLTVPTVSTMVKTWYRHVGLKGSYSSHTLRKTWGYWQRLEWGTAVPLLMEAFGHTTQQRPLAYLGIQSEEIAQIYDLEL